MKLSQTYIFHKLIINYGIRRFILRRVKPVSNQRGSIFFFSGRALYCPRIKYFVTIEASIKCFLKGHFWKPELSSINCQYA